MVDVRIEGSTIEGRIEIEAPPERVFRALIEPERLRAWWGARDAYWIERWSSDVRVGGAWESIGTGVSGQSFRVHGVFVEIDPPRRLVYTWNPSWQNAPETTVTYELAELPGRPARTLV